MKNLDDDAVYDQQREIIQELRSLKRELIEDNAQLKKEQEVLTAKSSLYLQQRDLMNERRREAMSSVEEWRGKYHKLRLSILDDTLKIEKTENPGEYYLTTEKSIILLNVLEDGTIDLVFEHGKCSINNKDN